MNLLAKFIKDGVMGRCLMLLNLRIIRFGWKNWKSHKFFLFCCCFYFAFSYAKFYSLKLSLRKRINIYKVCLLAAYPPVANLTFLPAMAMYFARKELGATAGLGGEPTHAPFTDLLRLEADTIDFALTGGPRVKSFVLHKSFPRTDIFSVFFCWHQDPCVCS